MSEKRNHLLAPRNVLNTTKLYTLYILKKLAQGNIIYGKEIYDDIKEYFKDYHIPVSYSTIYQTLHKLEEEGFIYSNWDTTSTSIKNRTKRYYRITDEGLRYYKVISKDIIDKLKRNRNLVDRFIEFLS